MFAGFSTMKGKPVLFSVLWNDNCRSYLPGSRDFERAERARPRPELAPIDGVQVGPLRAPEPRA